MGIHFILCDRKVKKKKKVIFFAQTAKIRQMMDELDVNAMSEYYRRKLK